MNNDILLSRVSQKCYDLSICLNISSGFIWRSYWEAYPWGLNPSTTEDSIPVPLRSNFLWDICFFPPFWQETWLELSSAWLMSFPCIVYHFLGTPQLFHNYLWEFIKLCLPLELSIPFWSDSSSPLGTCQSSILPVSLISAVIINFSHGIFH